MTAFSLAFAPLAPPWAFAVLALLAIAVFAGFVALRRRGGALRLALGGALLIALANPSLVEERREPLRDVAVVVVDHSPSQNLANRRAQTEAATQGLLTALKKFDHLDVRLIDAGDAAQDGTHLFAALTAGLADVAPERVAAAIMITDGQIHDIPAAPSGFKGPLHALITGDDHERERRLELVEAPRFGLIGKELNFALKVEDVNGPGGPIPVEVRRDGEVVARIIVKPGEITKIPVKLAHGGKTVLEFSAEALPGALSDLPAKAVASVEGVRDHLKILLVSGEPNPGERSWRNLLKSDPNVELVHFTILRPPEKQDGAPLHELALIAFPTAELFGKKIVDFDLILFDRFSNMGLLPPAYFENIVKYVRDGGALAIVAGPNFSEPDGLFYTPIGRIAPARPTGEVFVGPFRPEVTTLGARHPVARDLPGADRTPPDWSQFFRLDAATASRGATILSGAKNAPLVVLSHEGKGRVAQFLTDQFWLWARGYQGGGPYGDLMRRTAHWLMKEPELEEEALRASAQGAEVTIERQTLGESAGPARLIAPSGKSREIALSQDAPGLFRAHVRADEIGLFRVEQGDLKALVNVGPENPLEYRALVSTTEKIRPLAEATGGSARRIGRAGADAVHLPRLVEMGDSPVYAGADYIGIRRSGASSTRGVTLVPLAQGLVGLIVLLGLALACWIVEARRQTSGRTAPE